MSKKNHKYMQAVNNFSQITSHLSSLKKRKTVALACPDDSHTEYVINRALEEGIADFLLVTGGKQAPFVEGFKKKYPERVTIVSAGDPDGAAREAVRLVREGNADVLMKGTLNTDNLLRAVLDKECGLLEKGNVLTHVTVAQIPSYPKLLVFSDAAVIPRPTQEQFEAVTGYVIGVCRNLGVECPHVALIHCTEKVNPKFPHTLSYEYLKEKAKSGAWGNAVIDGPMDVKTACDSHSGEIKGILSPVAGKADALIFPNIEAGNVFYKTITLFADAQTAGMLSGTKAPVVVASRADSGESKFYSLATACMAID